MAKTGKQIQAEAELELRRRYGGGFKTFIENSDKNYIFYRHCNVLINVLDRVANGELKRVMIFMPPRHGKSETASRKFPAHYMFKNPSHHVGLTSYSAELAYTLSRDARGNYEHTGRSLSEEASAVKEWHTSQGGRFWSAGVGGSITGKGFHLGIIDDPIKNDEEAYSDKVRESVWDWYRTTFYTRQEPDAAIVIIQTRWHADDLSGRLLAQEKEIPENWHIVNLQAIRDKENAIKIPDTCTYEEDWREEGQALCPERYDEKKLFMMRKSAGEEIWGALYQQNPIIATGLIWKREWFENIVYDNEPENLQNEGYDWDTAETENEKNAAYAYVKSGINPLDGLIYVSAIDFKWIDFADYINWMIDLGGIHHIEGKSSGKSAVSMMNKVGAYAYEVPVRGGDKVARARIASPMVERGKVRIKRSVLHRLLYDDRQGIIKFPLGSHKDLNDAFVQMLNRLSPYIIREKEVEREKEWWELAYPEYAQSKGNPMRPQGFR